MGTCANSVDEDCASPNVAGGERWPQRDECDKLLTAMNSRARTQLLRAASTANPLRTHCEPPASPSSFFTRAEEPQTNVHLAPMRDNPS